jgi:hypothetical protein
LDFRSISPAPAGESSIYILDLDSFSSASHIRANSFSESFHFWSFQLSTAIDADISLSVSCSLDISSENIATFLPFSHTFWAKFSAIAVLPILGRAATIIRSPRLNPQSLWSKLGYPVCSVDSSAIFGSACIDANSSYLPPSISRICTSLFCINVCVTPNSAFSDFSNSVDSSVTSSNPHATISPPARMSFRSTDFHFTICAYWYIFAAVNILSVSAARNVFHHILSSFFWSSRTSRTVKRSIGRLRVYRSIIAAYTSPSAGS